MAYNLYRRLAPNAVSPSGLYETIPLLRVQKGNLICYDVDSEQRLWRILPPIGHTHAYTACVSNARAAYRLRYPSNRRSIDTDWAHVYCDFMYD